MPPPQAYLAQHRGQHGRHPVSLLAVLATLDRPASHDEGTFLGHPTGEVPDFVGGNLGDVRRPVGVLGLAVALSRQVGHEFLETHGVFLEELLIVKFLGIQRVRNTQHDRRVGLRTRRDPFRVEVSSGLGLARVDHHHGRSLGLERLEALETLMIRRSKTDVQGDQRIGAPDYHQFGGLHHAGPCRLRRIHFQSADHARQDSLRGTGAVVAHRGGIASMQVHQLGQCGARIVQAGGTPPSHVADVEAGRSELGLDALQFADHQVQCLIPRHAHEFAVAAFAGVALRPLLEEAFAYHRILDPTGRVDQRRRPVDHLRHRMRVFLERQRLDEAAVFDHRAHDAPVSRGQHALGRGRSLSGLCRHLRGRGLSGNQRAGTGHHGANAGGERSFQKRTPGYSGARPYRLTIFTHDWILLLIEELSNFESIRLVGKIIRFSARSGKTN